MNKLSTSKNMKIQMLKRLIRKGFVILFIVFSFILIFVGKPDSPIINKTSGVVAGIMSPVISVVSYPIYIVGSFIEDIKNFRTVDKQNKELKSEISELKEQLNYFKQMETQNAELIKLTEYKTNTLNFLLSTKVLASTGSGFAHSFILDAGAKDGIEKYQGVLVDGYLVGQIITTGLNYSRMILITDATSKIPVQIERTRTRAFLIGNNTNYPQLMHFENQEPVQIGDVVITSGMGAKISFGIPIGIVGSISEENGIIVQPFIDNSNIEYVKVLKTSHTKGVKDFTRETSLKE